MFQKRRITERDKLIKSLLDRGVREDRVEEVEEKINRSILKVHALCCFSDDIIDYDRLKWDTTELSRAEKAACVLQILDMIDTSAAPPLHQAPPRGLFSRNFN